MAKKSPIATIAHDERMNARRSVVEELFNDFYDDRRSIYRMNFLRGVFFGLGSVLGGSIIAAIVVWILSLFIQIPAFNNAAQKAQTNIESTQTK